MFGVHSLDNVLPPITSKESLIQRSSLANWRPVKPFGSKTTSRSIHQLNERKTIINSTSIPHYVGPEPNAAFDVTISDNDLVLSQSDRGEAPILTNRICVPCTNQSRRTKSFQIPSFGHIYKISNLMADIRMGVFMSASRKVNYKVLSFNESLTLAQDAYLIGEQTSSKNCYVHSFSFITMREAAILISDSDSIENFVFQPGPIGLELAMQNSRIVCSAVLENSQASSLYGNSMVGMEILSINNEYITDLESFKDIVNMHQYHSISITVVRRHKRIEVTESLHKLFPFVPSEGSLHEHNKSYNEQPYHTRLGVLR
jgi:hypothetical protein